MSDTSALLDTLLDLKHDLGKHLLLPLSLLPKDAAAADVVQAAQDALQRTRRGPQGEQSARALWDEFVNEHAGQLDNSKAYAALAQIVEVALAWESALCMPTPDLAHAAKREDITHDFKQVGLSIVALIAEVRQQGGSEP